MGLRASDLPEAVQAALAKQLAKEHGEPIVSNVLWLLRTPMLSVKPIRTRDPVLFLEMVKKIQGLYPNLKLYIFRIEGV